MASPSHGSPAEPSRLRQALRMTAALGAGEIAARLIQTVAFVLLARAIGPEMLGHWGFVGALMTYALLGVGLGMDAIAIRESAGRPEAAKDYLGWILSLRVTIAILVVAGVWIFVLAAEPREVWMVLFGWQSISVIGRGAAPRWRLMLDHHARPIAAAAVIAQLVYLAGVLTVRGDADVWRAAAAVGLGDVVAGFWMLRGVLKRCGAFLPVVDVAAWKKLLLDGLPIALTRLLVVYRMSIHVFLLRTLATAAQLGVFVAGYRFVAVFGLLGAALRGGLYPSLSKEASAGGDPIKLAARAGAGVGALLMLPAAAIALAAPLLMTRLFGPEYAEGAPMLRVLTLVIPMIGVRTVLRQMLIVRHLERWDLAAMILVSALETVWAAVAVPTQGGMGCAVAIAAGEAAYLVLGTAGLASGAGRYVDGPESLGKGGSSG